MFKEELVEYFKSISINKFLILIESIKWIKFTIIWNSVV